LYFVKQALSSGLFRTIRRCYRLVRIRAQTTNWYSSDASNRQGSNVSKQTYGILFPSCLFVSDMGDEQVGQVGAATRSILPFLKTAGAKVDLVQRASKWSWERRAKAQKKTKKNQRTIAATRNAGQNIEDSILIVAVVVVNKMDVPMVHWDNRHLDAEMRDQDSARLKNVRLYHQKLDQIHSYLWSRLCQSTAGQVHVVARIVHVGRTRRDGTDSHKFDEYVDEYAENAAMPRSPRVVRPRWDLRYPKLY
jgi:hypothetical protein